MTVTSGSDTYKLYSGNGTTHVFAYTFRVFTSSELLVLIRNNTTGATHIATDTARSGAYDPDTHVGGEGLNTAYILSGVDDANGGNVTFKYDTGNPSDANYSTTDYRPQTGESVIIIRVPAISQETNYVPGGAFPAESHEDALDKLTFHVQRIEDQLNKTIQRPEADTGVVSSSIDSSLSVLPDNADLKGKYLSFNSSTGAPEAGANVSDVALLASSQTLTNKTINADNNTISNIEVDNLKASAVVTEAEGIQSNDNDTSLPTSAAVKDYVDSQATGETLNVNTDGGNFALTIDSETLTFDGGSGITTSSSGTTVQIDIDTSVVTLNDTQTLTNKSIDAAQLTGTIDDARIPVAATDSAGLMSAADKTKMDGIETAATADQTAAEILTEIKTVDGASSGLDADLLDGQEGSYYTSYADTAVSNLVDSAPSTLDTLNELAAALGDDANFSTTVTNSIATKLPLAGGTMTGNIVMSGTETVDGRDLSVDGAKLDGIEASADVTDTANVTAAGALMDSEVTNLAQVKAFDSSDYATAAQGTTADAAMPKAGGTFTGDVTFADDQELRIGDGTDLKIWHQSSSGNSFIQEQNPSGSLKITGNEIQLLNALNTEYKAKFKDDGTVELYYNGAKKVETTSGGIEVDADGTGGTVGVKVNKDDNTGYFFSAQYDGTVNSGRLYSLKPPTTDSGSEPFIWETGNSHAFNTDGTERLRINSSGDVEIKTGHLELGDDQEIRLGDSDDFKLFHKSSTNQSIINEGGAGSMLIQASNMFLQNNSGGQTYAKFTDGGAAELYYDNYKTFATTSEGVDVYNNDATNTDGPVVNLRRDSASPAVNDILGDVRFLGRNDAAQYVGYAGIDGIIYDETDGTENGALRISAINNGTNTTYLTFGDGRARFNQDARFDDDVKATFGTSGDLEIFHNGSSSVINDVGTGKLTIGANDRIDLMNPAATEYYARFILDGAVELYYDNVKKFETTADGVTITSTDDGAVDAPILKLNRDSASPTDGDDLGRIEFNGKNDAGQDVGYGVIFTEIGDASDGTEDARMKFATVVDGSQKSTMEVKFGTVSVNGQLNVTTGGDIRFEGTTADNFETVLSPGDPTADRTITLPDATGTVVVDADGATIDTLYVGRGASSVTTNTAVGVDALSSVTTGLVNTAVGYDAGEDITTGERNTLVGFDAGTELTTGSRNTSIGHLANANATTGSNNTVVGSQALQSATTGSNNTVSGYLAAPFLNASNNNIFGYQAFFDATTAGNCVAIGASALRHNVAGNGGIAIGHNSQYYANSTATSYTNTNTSVGYESLLGSTTAANNTGLNNTALGYQTLRSNTTGDNNVATGHGALYSNASGGGNAAYGYQTLLVNTTGSSNVATGFRCLYSNTTGAANVAVGLSSTESNTTGTNNTAVGIHSLQKNTTGTTNVAIGGGALRENTTASNNTAVGRFAMVLNTTGTQNTAVGNYSLDANTTGSYNTVTGYAGLTANTTGVQNAAFGYQSMLSNNTGSYNTGLGMSALQSNTSGNNNVAVGRLALSDNTTASENVAVGRGALERNTTGTNNIAIGSLTLNNATTANSNVAVGKNNLRENTTGNNNTAVGDAALRYNTEGGNNTAYGYNSVAANTTGNNNVGVGYRALYNSTTGTDNTAVGTLALSQNTTASSNTGMGRNALESNTTGSSGTAVGQSALQENTTGSTNTAVGYQSLFTNTTGGLMTAIGGLALRSNTTASSNTAVGHSALYSNTTGDLGTALGRNALQYNTTGSSNTAVGVSALQENTTGRFNTSVGFQSSFNPTTASENTSVGYQALRSGTTGGNNTAIGKHAMFSNTEGNTNVAVGRAALYTNTTGAANVAVGNDALQYNTTGGGHVAVGRSALRDNTTATLNTAVGVNSQERGTTATANSSLGYRSLYLTTTGSYNTGLGYETLRSNTTGIDNTATGYQALYNNTDGDKNAALGNGALFTSTSGERNSAVGYRSMYSTTTGTNNAALGDSALYNNTTGSGNFGAAFRTSSGSYAPVFNPTTESNRVVMGHTSVTNAYVQVAWTVVSDERDKTQIAPLEMGLDVVQKLNPVSYKFRADRSTEETVGNKRYGFLAQDVLALEGDDNVIVDNEDPDKLKMTNEELIPVLVKAIQEQQTQISELKAEIKQLKEA